MNMSCVMVKWVFSGVDSCSCDRIVGWMHCFRTLIRPNQSTVRTEFHRGEIVFFARTRWFSLCTSARYIPVNSSLILIAVTYKSNNYLHAVIQASVIKTIDIPLHVIYFLVKWKWNERYTRGRFLRKLSSHS